MEKKTMSQEVELVTKEAKSALVITESVGTFKLGKVMGPAYMEIQNYLNQNGIQIKEAPFTIYQVENWEETINMSGLKAIISLFIKKWNIEMGFEIPESMEGVGRIKPITLPRGQYLQTMHLGPYHKVGDSYKKIYQFSKENGYALGNCSYEYYLNDPRETPKDKLETKVIVPIK